MAKKGPPIGNRNAAGPHAGYNNGALTGIVGGLSSPVGSLLTGVYGGMSKSRKGMFKQNAYGSVTGAVAGGIIGGMNAGPGGAILGTVAGGVGTYGTQKVGQVMGARMKKATRSR